MAYTVDGRAANAFDSSAASNNFNCKKILGRDLPPNKWGVDQAKKYLEDENSIFGRILARGLIIANTPLYFAFGWAVGGALIANIIYKGH
jgi:hypothetical protein